MSARYPIPDAALDDRLAFVGTSGSGKTYAAGTAVERLMQRKARVVIVDPLGVWWGLRLASDGKGAGFPVVIFGGEHGDLALTEHAGKVIGETVAGMAESCIVSLDGLGSKAAERRFMLAFLEAMYRKASGEPFHLVFDEADLWAPQKSSEPHLQNLMENIVRRGRVKGFVPWLITQRPAVLSKDVLSQADGLVAMKLTSSQDRDALGGWIEGQADRAEEKRILARLPQLETGQGIVWIPGRGALDEARFPAKATFDSSRTPRRGEKKRAATLEPIDLGALKERLGKVEAETKANDPKVLKARIADLERAAARTIPAAPDPAAVASAERSGYERGFREGHESGWSSASAAIAEALRRPPAGLVPAPDQPKHRPAPVPTPAAVSPAPTPPLPAPGDAAVSPAKRRVLDVLAWFRALGVPEVERNRVAVMCGLSPKASTFGVYASDLMRQGLVEAAGPGMIRGTPAGLALAQNLPDSATTIVAEVRKQLKPAATKLFDIIVAAAPDAVTRGRLADEMGLSRTASTLGVYLSELSSRGFVENAGPGLVKAADWLFLEPAR